MSIFIYIYYNIIYNIIISLILIFHNLLLLLLSNIIIIRLLNSSSTSVNISLLSDYCLSHWSFKLKIMLKSIYIRYWQKTALRYPSTQWFTIALITRQFRLRMWKTRIIARDYWPKQPWGILWGRDRFMKYWANVKQSPAICRYVKKNLTPTSFLDRSRMIRLLMYPIFENHVKGL